MPQALGSLGGVFGGGGGGALDVPTWMKLVLGGVTGAGEIGNILADRQRAGLLDQEKKWANLTPQQLSAKIAAATQPLSQGLTQAVGNTVQAQAGERGLAQSPGIFQAMLAQALAPYYQQNQNTALEAILKQMGLPAQAGALLPGNTNLSPLLALLMRSVASPTSGATSNTGDFGPPPYSPDPTNTDTGVTPPNFGGDTSVGVPA